MEHQGNDIKEDPPISMHRGDVVEERMKMLAVLLDQINGEVIVQKRVTRDKKEGNKGGFVQAVADILFHRVK